MSVGLTLSLLPTQMTDFSQLQTQGKPLSYSSEGKKMRKKNVLVSETQTILPNQLLSDHRMFSKSK